MVSLVGQLPSATAFIDRELRFVAVSEKWADFFETDIRDLLNTKADKIFHVHQKEFKTYLDGCLKHSENLNWRVQFNKPSKTWIDLTFKPWFNENEDQTGIIVDLVDVSKEMALQKKSKKLKLRLEETSEISKVGMWEFDIIEKKLSWSKITKKIHEVPNDYIPNVESAITFYKEGYSRNTVAMNFQKALDTGEPFGGLLQIVTANGKEVWVRNAGKPIYKNNKLVKIIGTFQNVDEQVRAEMKIRENEKLLESIIDNLPLNVYVKDEDSRKILVNKAECEYVGVEHKDELLGKNDFDIYDKRIAQMSRDEDVEVIKTQHPIIGRETTSIKKNGAKTTFLTSKIPLTDMYGKAIGIIGISMDISNLKKKEAELKDLINITALQNKKLLNFAHIVSHNLRSHSANFSMLLNFLTKEEDTEEKQRIIEMLVNASDNLMVTLEDLNMIIDINDKVNLNKKALNLNDKLLKVQQNLSTYLEESNAQIINRIPKNVKIHAVPAYLESVLLNLLTNAIKYKHPKRQPMINLSVKHSEQHTILIFEDNGLGIDLEKNGDKLFGMYKTFHGNKDARGMGLYISKNQMEAMGGTITAESEVGKGTIFKVYFYEK